MNGEMQCISSATTSMYVGWDKPKYVMVCLIISHQVCSDQLILGEVMPALLSAGVLLREDTYKVNNKGNIAIIGKSRGYIGLETDSRTH